MPSHLHGYKKFRCNGIYFCDREYTKKDYLPYETNGKDFLENASTDSIGGGKAHNNMPPYITANCWRRTG